MIEKEELEDLYIKQNLTREEISDVYKCSVSKVKSQLREFGIKKTKELEASNRKRLYKLKTGYDNPMQNPDVQNKTWTTIEARYGVRNMLLKPEVRNITSERIKVDEEYKDSIQKKINETNIKRYGASRPAGNKDICSKIQKSILENNDRELINDKIKQSYKNKHNGKYAIQYHINNFDTYTNKIEFKKLIDNNPNWISSDYECFFNINNSSFNAKLRELGLSKYVSRLGSRFENEIKDYIQNELGIQCYKTRKELYPLEIDLYSEEYKIGIEFNGNYWHNEVNKEFKYHQNKTLLAEQKGIELIHIFEYEWVNNVEKIKSYIKQKFHKDVKSIHARKCEVKEICTKEKDDLLKLSHLQGTDRSSIKLGLYFNNELLQVMTFGKPRYNKKYEWELYRMATLPNYVVRGGGSKLLSYFIKNFKPSSIISYQNITKFNRNVYGNMGFNLLHITDPNYIWFRNNNDYLTRYQSSKRKTGIKELENMRNKGYYRIYDCGNKVWSMECKN